MSDAFIRLIASAYLVGWMTTLSTVLGMLLIVLIAHALEVRWIVVVRRLAENVTATLPWLALTFIPLIAISPAIYPAMRGGFTARPHLVTYLSTPMVAVRAAIYFAVWIGLAEVIRRRALAAPIRDARKVAAAGIPLFAITITLASYDWLIALTPEWSSTVYGVYVFASGFVSAWALLALLAWRSGRANPSHYHAVGRMLFAFVIFWAYIGFGQFFIIYMGDLPEEVHWVLVRIDPQFRWMTTALVVLHFVAPFFVLLSRASKRRPKVLVSVAVLLVAMHAVDMAFLVVPSVERSLSWFDLVALALLASTTTAFGYFRARGHAPVPDNDPLLAASLTYTS